VAKGKVIAADEFQQRLGQLCLSHGGELPRKQRDREIVLKSAALCFVQHRTYSEREVNALLKSWIEEIGRGFNVDHAALRRYLIDHRYLERSAAGNSYQLSTARSATLFAPEVDRMDPAAAVEAAREQAALKKAQHQAQQFPNRPSGQAQPNE
jgi:hypothetical protein